MVGDPAPVDEGVDGGSDRGGAVNGAVIAAERNILASVNSPFIVHLHYAFQTDEKLYFVVDFLNGGELFFHLRKDVRFPESRTRFYAAEITLAIEELHKNKIIYR